MTGGKSLMRKFLCPATLTRVCRAFFFPGAGFQKLLKQQLPMPESARRGHNFYKSVSHRTQ
jgi:hypothetical protein